MTTIWKNQPVNLVDYNLLWRWLWQRQIGQQPEYSGDADDPEAIQIFEANLAEWQRLFDLPPVELWANPYHFTYSRFWRWLCVKILGQVLIDPRNEWVDQLEQYYQRMEREAEEFARWQQQQSDWEALMAEYQEQGEHMAEMLPYYLHNLKLSYRRNVQDRKTERFYERVDYCQIEDWHFDESAYYFWLNTWEPGAFPWGLTVKMFLEPEIKDTLTVNFGSECFIENNPREHSRPGLWVVVMHKAGKGLVPKMVNYSDMLQKMPKTAPSLAFPVGMGRNGKYFYGDMDELITILVVGSRGAGKSNSINVILNTWLTRVGPEQLRLFLTDLKGGLEFYDYHGIPHLGGDVDIKMRLKKEEGAKPVRLGQEIMTDPPQVIPCLKYIEAEMNRRFEIMKGHAKKISAYNRRNDSKLSYWILVVDELATLMDSGHGKEAATLLGEIARKGRAVGIYMILATQIPDKSVLTRQVAGNMDCRIVGRVADGPSSALSLGDGSWDAVYLPKDIPGRVIWRWADKVVLQAPFIPDLTIKQTIARLRDGQQAAPADAAEQAIAMELFGYAMESLGGLCKRSDLYKHFKVRMSQNNIESILNKFEVHQYGDGLGPVIHINENDYYLSPPSPDGNRGKLPRQLIEVNEFRNDNKWHEIIAARTAHGARRNEKPETMTDQNFKPDEAVKFLQPVELHEAVASVVDGPMEPLSDSANGLPAHDAEGLTDDEPESAGGQEAEGAGAWEAPDWLDNDKPVFARKHKKLADEEF